MIIKRITTKRMTMRRIMTRRMRRKGESRVRRCAKNRFIGLDYLVKRGVV
jgi:hypothetical protein